MGEFFLRVLLLVDTFSTSLMIGYLFKFDGPEASDPDEGSNDVSKDGTQQLKLLTRDALKADRYPLSMNMICPLFRWVVIVVLDI